MPSYEEKFNKRIADIRERNDGLVEEINQLINNNERQFWMTIVPENTSGTGDPECVLVVTEHIVVIIEPIAAKHANDMDALYKARAAVANRLNVDIESVEY